VLIYLKPDASSTEWFNLISALPDLQDTSHLTCQPNNQRYNNDIPICDMYHRVLLHPVNQ